MFCVFVCRFCFHSLNSGANKTKHKTSATVSLLPKWEDYQHENICSLETPCKNRNDFNDWHKNAMHSQPAVECAVFACVNFVFYTKWSTVHLTCGLCCMYSFAGPNLKQVEVLSNLHNLFIIAQSNGPSSAANERLQQSTRHRSERLLVRR